MVRLKTSPLRLNVIVKVCLLICLTGVTISCKKSSEDPEVKSTASVSASFTFSNTDSWPESYQVILGAFGDDNTQTSSFTVLTKPSGTETVTVKLENVPAASKKISLCLAVNGKVTYTFYSYDYQGTDTTIPLQNINLLPYQRIQDQVFTAHCITCHGGSSGSPAAGMYLTDGKSYDQLVNHQATESSKVRVMAFNTANSFLIDVLRIKGISFEHSASRSISEENIALLELWIRNGALKN